MEQLNRIELKGVVGNVRIQDFNESRMARIGLATNYAYKDREGVAVIEEEYIEAKDEFNALRDNLWELKKKVFYDETRANRKINTKQMYNIALCGACELIQVAAMAKKFDDSAEVRGDD